MSLCLFLAIIYNPDSDILQDGLIGVRLPGVDLLAF